MPTTLGLVLSFYISTMHHAPLAYTQFFFHHLSHLSHHSLLSLNSLPSPLNKNKLLSCCVGHEDHGSFQASIYPSCKYVHPLLQFQQNHQILTLNLTLICHFVPLFIAPFSSRFLPYPRFYFSLETF